MTFMEWYNTLEKPAWTPQPATIGMIWQILYPIILVTFGWVFWRTATGRLPWQVALPFGLNLLANLLFPVVHMGLKSNLLAALDIVAVWGTLVWLIVTIWPLARWVAVLQVPYLGWVSIATLLQLLITWMNRGR
ncbi:MAG: TspO/MBR family protein [Planctomycetaceae bacterium]